METFVTPTGSALGPLAFTLWYKKEGEKRRLIAEPSEALREYHYRFLEFFERFPLQFPSASGSLQGCSPIENARRHRDGKYFYQLDLKNAFPSMEPKRLSLAIVSLIPFFETKQEELEETLREYFFVEGYGLAQGGPASPFLFNLYCEARLDRQIRALLTLYDAEIVYSRYVDDLTFSCTSHAFSETLKAKIRRLIRQAGFTVHPHKSQATVLDGHQTVTITGVRLTPNRGVNLPKTSLRTLEQELEHWFLSRDPTQIRRLHGLIAQYVTVSAHTSMRDRERRRISEKVERFQGLVYVDRVSVNKEHPNRLPLRWVDYLLAAIPLDEYLKKRGVKQFKYRAEGREAIALCPFHHEKSPSFTVALTKGFFHCFGCGAHGNAIGFEARIRNVDAWENFAMIARDLAAEFDVPLPSGYGLSLEKPGQQKRKRRQKRRREREDDDELF